MTFTKPDRDGLLTFLSHQSSTLRRKAGGYQLTHFRSLGIGALAYGPHWFPKTELLTAIGYAEMAAGLLFEIDKDTRPRWIEQSAEIWRTAG